MAEQGPSVAFHPSAARRALLFGPFRFDAIDKTLSREGQEIRLPPRALLILDHLLERPNRIVGKQELLDRVWKDAFVGESSLTEAIGVLRQALGDTASGAEYIQTVHRRGYRFVAPVRVDAQPAPALAPVPSPPPIAVPTPTPVPAPPPASAEPAIQPGRVEPRSRVGLYALTAAVIALASVAGWFATRPAAEPATTRATITLPVSQAPAPGLTAQPVATLSPDGRRIIYVAGAPGSYRLYLRAIDQFEAVPVPGTDGAHGAFFSPDGNAIGFFVRERLMVLTLPGGDPIDLADAESGHGGWWHTDGSIFFSTGGSDGIYRVAATGGERRPVKIVGFDGAALRHPTLTPDGRTMLATLWKFNVRRSEVVAIDLASGAGRVIARGVHPRALDDGRVIYLRDGDLVARSFDGSGAESTLISGVMTGITAAGQYSLSANGTLLYLPDSPERLLRRIVRISFDGREEPLLFEPRAFQNVSVSPDGRKLALTIYEMGASDLWIGDIERGVLQRLMMDGGSVDPLWSPDGSFLYFAWSRAELPNIYRIPVDASRPPTIHSSVPSLSPSAVTRSGQVFATRYRPGGGTDISLVARDGTARDWLATAAQESMPRVSPDERYVAYRSLRSGRSEIYVRPISGHGPEQQISDSGGTRPDWSPDSQTIYFVGPRRSIQRVEWRDGVASRPKQIYASPGLLWSRVGPGGIIGLKAIEEERPLTTLNLVVGWTREVSTIR